MQNFGRGEISSFLMKCPEQIGVPLSVQIWHDNSGGSAAGWFLGKLAFVDLQQKRWSVFSVNQTTLQCTVNVCVWQVCGVDWIAGIFVRLGSVSLSCPIVLGLASITSVCVVGVGLGTMNGVLALGLATVSFAYGLASGAGRSRPPGFRPETTFTGIVSLSLSI